MQEIIKNIEKTVTYNDHSSMSSSEAIRKSAKNIAVYAIEHMTGDLLRSALDVVFSVTILAEELEK